MKEWSFKDKDIVDKFEDHVTSHLPWYSLATDLVKYIAENYLPEDGILYDIGASKGNVTRALMDLIETRSIRATSFDSSIEMCEKWEGVGDIFNIDIEEVDGSFDVAICYLALMFNSVSKRRNILEGLYTQVREGGCVIIVEKFEIEEGGYASTIQRRITMRGKLDRGVSAEEIVDKELSLSGVQRPLKASELSLFDASEFFRFGEFRGYILTKGEK